MSDPARPSAVGARPAVPLTPADSDRPGDTLGGDPAPSAANGSAAPTLDPGGDPAFAPTLAPAGPAGGINLTGRDFGDFELLEEVARGGMGVVFRARQKSIQRIVAVKMILAGHLASHEQVRRFHAEAEEAGQLDHPNIVPIYQVGEEHGQHYFAMKLIEGGSLAARVKDMVGRPRDAARLVATVARAVHYAHQRGILHRDIKPGNILLDRDGQPHVTDFGLAKHLEGDPSGTQLGAILGTPSYMAPEQAAARKDLTTEADVYALGAVLYELLTGRPPFHAATPLDTLLQVLEQDPARPRTVRADVPRDLETVCLSCLAKDPARRYHSAALLADDLERVLGGEPIQARPVGRLERARLWARRRPAHAALLAVSVLAALALVAGGWWHNRSLQRALDTAEFERGEAERHRAEAERNEAEAKAQQAKAAANFQKARDAVDGLLTRVVEGRLSHLRGMETVRLEFLQDVQAFYEGFLKEQSNDPAIRQEAARAHRRLGDGSRLAKLYHRGEPAYKRAIDLQAKLVADFPSDPHYQDDLAVTYRNLAELHKADSKPAEATTACREAVTLRAKLADDHPQSPEYRQRYALVLHELANLLKQAKDFTGAEAAFREALSVQEALVAARADVPGYASELGTTAHNLAVLLAEAGEGDEARERIDNALTAQRTAVRLDPNNPTYRQHLKTHTTRRTLLLREQKDHAALARAADEWRQDFAGAVETYTVACHLAAAAALAAADPDVGETGRPALVVGYADRAAAALRDAVSQGYANAAQIAREPDLAAVRDRPDVQALLTDLDRRNPEGHLTPAREYYALVGEYQAAQQEYYRLIVQARTAAERQQAAAKLPKTADFARRFQDLAQRTPDAPAALDALIWVVNNAVTANLSSIRNKALEQLATSHLNDPRMAVVCAQLGSTTPDGETVGQASSAGDRLLQQLIEKSPHREVRGLALFTRAEAVKKKGDSAAGKKQANANDLTREAEQLFDRIATQYADVKRPSSTATLGPLATSELLEIRTLGIGKVAPEMEGEDLDGKPFKLSDYRGKVVVLAFWADWCGFCRVMYPTKRDLVKRLEGQPFALLGVNSDDELSEIKKVIEKDQITWRSWFDGGAKGNRLRRQWNVKAWPTTIFLDHKGAIRLKKRGAISAEDLNKTVDDLLAEMKADQAATAAPGQK